MATHAPHVRTKRPLRGRSTRPARPLLAKLRHAPGVHALGTKLVRRGPTTGERELPVDTTFRLAAGGVIVAAAVLGIAMGLAQPSWMLAAALIAGGALVAGVVAVLNGTPTPMKSAV